MSLYKMWILEMSQSFNKSCIIVTIEEIAYSLLSNLDFGTLLATIGSGSAEYNSKWSGHIYA